MWFKRWPSERTLFWFCVKYSELGITQPNIRQKLLQAIDQIKAEHVTWLFYFIIKKTSISQEIINFICFKTNFCFFVNHDSILICAELPVTESIFKEGCKRAIFKFGDFVGHLIKKLKTKLVAIFSSFNSSFWYEISLPCDDGIVSPDSHHSSVVRCFSLGHRQQPKKLLMNLVNCRSGLKWCWHHRHHSHCPVWLTVCDRF